MSILRIHVLGSPVLRQVTKEVATVTDDHRRLIDDMFETMYAAPGIGLAATQVNVHKQLLVLDVSEERNAPLVLINPRITAREGSQVYQEGCLSVPDIYADVERPKTCRVRWQDLDGNVHEEAMEGIMATCIQHEMDHLEGILFIDHLSRLKRTMALKKLEKLRKAA